jgi:hypothetical protein
MASTDALPQCSSRVVSRGGLDSERPALVPWDYWFTTGVVLVRGLP